MERKSFVIYTESGELIKKLNMEQRGELFTAIFDHVSGGDPKELDPLTDMVFTVIKNYMDKDFEKYSQKCQKNRESANRRWGKFHESPQNAEYERMRTHTNGRKRTKTYYDSDNDSDNNESDNDSDNTHIQKPTVQEIDKFIRENGYNINAKYFFDYYNSNGWSDRKGNPVDNWKQRVVSWAARSAETEPEKKAENSKIRFNNFHQREYNECDLERMLLNQNNGNSE